MRKRNYFNEEDLKIAISNFINNKSTLIILEIDNLELKNILNKNIDNNIKQLRINIVHNKNGLFHS